MNIVVAQSGGPTTAINASLLGVYKQARQWPGVDTVYGAKNGIEGVLKDDLLNLNDYLATGEAQALLRQTPSSFLGSCRYKLPCAQAQPAVYETIRAVLERHDIGAFFYIGGNDSMDTVDKLSAYFAQVGCPIQVMGVPKTIDNDLVHADHTPGYGSAAKFIATAMTEMIRDAAVYDLPAVLIVEIMGRDTGWLTAAAALPWLNGEQAPHLVYLPEVPFTADAFLADVRRVQEHTNTVIVAVSEGVTLEEVSAFQSGAVDAFGHKHLSGIGKCLETLVKEKLGCKVRSVELNVLQRCAAHCASDTDLTEAELVGAAAVQAAQAGATGQVAMLQRAGDMPYQATITCVPVCEVANQVKYVPREWINEEGNRVNEKALAYIRPLIMGEPSLLMENGVPRVLRMR